MENSILTGMLTADGLWQLPLYGYALVTLVLCQITIACVTLYLHRSQAHRSVEFHPAVAHFMRFWLWTTTGMRTRQWVAVHRKHHAKCETRDDPHSPKVKGIMRVLFDGAGLYYEEAGNRETIEQYGHGCPDDYMERHLYSARQNLGVSLLLLLLFLCFGFVGVCMWAVQMMWIPFFAAGVINGLGHYMGYRNFDTEDVSKNLCNMAFFIGGEELHNNHHAYPSSAKMSIRWWEFDVGWMYIRILKTLRLARVLRLAPIRDSSASIDPSVVGPNRAKDLLHGKLYVAREYITEVLSPLFFQEIKSHKGESRQSLHNIKKSFLSGAMSLMSEDEYKRLVDTLHLHQKLLLAHQLQKKLVNLWQENSSMEDFWKSVLSWCQQAESSGIQLLHEFSHRLKGFALTTPPNIIIG